ncbi:hypothetical protein Droror1_Dr00014438 [Drosera rotundifolia]
MLSAEEKCLGEQCARWAKDYLGYCLCSPRDAASLTLGMISVVTWGVAEVPQIITNYRTKSTSGLSFAFLFTWIIGDLFNLFGCLLEPATLPTQYYMALLYTVTTLILTLQSVYYVHIYPRLKSTQSQIDAKSLPARITGRSGHASNGEEKLIKGTDKQGYGSTLSEDGTPPSYPIPLPSVPRSFSGGSHGADSYYMSARSLSTSHTPTMGSLLHRRASIEFENPAEEPLLFGSPPPKTTSHLNTKTVLCLVSVVTFFVGGYNTSRKKIRQPGIVLEMTKRSTFKQLKRRLLQVDGKQVMNSGGGGSGGLGAYMGWAMAVIYMGGRLPQILLNIRRGNVEGLSPFMFIFALVGNGTYVASILVNSLEWSKISPNLPWLVDAGGCVLLDTFILIQFIYFHFWASKYLVVKKGDHSSA